MAAQRCSFFFANFGVFKWLYLGYRFIYFTNTWQPSKGLNCVFAIIVIEYLIILLNINPIDMKLQDFENLGVLFQNIWVLCC